MRGGEWFLIGWTGSTVASIVIRELVDWFIDRRDRKREEDQRGS